MRSNYRKKTNVKTRIVFLTYRKSYDKAIHTI